MAEKVSRRLVILSGAAIAAVYAAGYRETRAADAQLAGVTTPIAVPAAASAPGGALATPSVQVAATMASVATAMPTIAQSSPANTLPLTTGAAPGNAGAPGVGGTPTPVATSTAAPSPTKPAATAAATPAPVAKQAATTGYKDGTYQGAGTSRRGGVVVVLTIQGGRIARVAITQSTTQYPVSRIAGLPAEVVAQQSAQVDLVSGATFSSLAFQGAVQQALAEARIG